jgi:hypothetical protein
MMSCKDTLLSKQAYDGIQMRDIGLVSILARLSAMFFRGEFSGVGYDIHR